MWTELKNLKESNEFLNLLLDNINSAVLIADENLRIHQFNDSFLNLFDKATESVLEATFGETLGCVNAIIENKACGATSQCSQCILRSSLIHNLIDRAPVNNQSLNRVFYIKGEPVEKHFQFSTRPITFQGRKMFLIIIYDVTDIELQKIRLQTGDKILLYTDGLPENRNSAGAFFGKQRFYDNLKKYRNQPVQEIVEAIYATAKEFRQEAKPDDDISILGVEYCG